MGLHTGICAFFHCKCAILDDVFEEVVHSCFIYKYISFMPFGFLNSYWHFNIETGFMCCCNVEFSFQKFVENNSISAKSDAQITILGINKDWVGWRKSALFPITH